MAGAIRNQNHNVGKSNSERLIVCIISSTQAKALQPTNFPPDRKFISGLMRIRFNCDAMLLLQLALIQTPS